MLYDHLKFKNTETGEEQTYQLAVSQYGESSPSSTTPGKPGVLYLNTFNGNLYKCTAADPANNSYTWVAMVGAGGLFATTVNGEGAEEISVQTPKIHKPNVGYVLSIGDKLITPDNYLYEITALPADLTSGYTAKLVQQLGAAVRTKGVLIEASVAGNMAQTVSIPKSNLVMPDESYSPVGGDYVITTDNCLYRVTGIAVSSDSGEESYTCSLIRTVAGSLQGDRNPDNTTAGTPGQLYLNTINGNLYKCTAADPESGVYTWVAMVGAGGLFYTTVTSEGAEEISVQTLKIHKPNVGYVLSIGDKLITPDNYLYEITALPEGLTGGYTAKLIRSLNLNLTMETITIEDDSGETENVPVTGLSLDLTSYSAKVGDGFYINPVITPGDATNKAVTWKSNATNIATVNNSGYVECIAEGSAVITCTTVDGGFTATCSVSVAAESSGEPEVTLSSIFATYSGGDVAVGTAVTDLTGIVVTAHYSDGSTATVTDYTLSGTIAEGSNTIAVSYGGKTTTFTVTGVAESTGGKIQFSTLEETSGFFKADGTVASLGSTYHVSFPYTEGMQVSTGTNGSWNTSTYPPIVVLDNGVYNTPACTKADSTISVGGKIVTQYTATLTGYSENAVVYASFLTGTLNATDITRGMDDADIYWYIPGGEA